MSKTAIIVGASFGVGRAIAEGLARDGWDLVIASRGQSDLDSLAGELTRDHNIAVAPISVDLSGTDEALESFVEAANAAAPEPDAVLITAGIVNATDEGIGDWAETSDLVAANMTGVMKLAGHYVGGMEKRDNGTIVLFSSIAAAAPRSKNVAYSAAKAGLESFAKSMQHRLGRSKAAVQIYRLGYVNTRLAAGQDLKLKPADPAKVAARVIRGLGGRSITVFEPRYWSVIVRALRILPASIYNRLDF